MNRKIIDPVGGQALIEGVMMRSKNVVSMSTRKKDGSIVTKTLRHTPLNVSKPYNYPIIRGSVGMIDMLVIGFKALNWSADQQLGKEEKITSREIISTTFLALVGTFLIFVALPYYLSTLITTPDGVIFHIIDGLLRLALFVGYISLISLMSDVRTMFEYHGAEHKAVHCYESGKKLTPENVLRFPKEHPRCGTSFLIIVLAISIITFSIVRTDSSFWNVALRIILIPLIMGVSYEFLKLSAKNADGNMFKFIVAPGLWMQKITTREPNKKQAEVAITALKNAL
ncbi:DUF1385 domain-containing protein [Candidatus Woesearchaeota archaeon]|nr:DUF1385 domain-containing protein [Candidatus Woesearchaeota archaeon]